MSEPKKLSLPVLGDVDRRTAVKAGAATLGLAAWAAAIKPWFEWTSELNTDEFLQKHYRELTPEQLQGILNKLTAEARAETGRPVTVKDHKPIPGVSFAYALNLSICIGCRKCAEACHVENNHDRPSHQSYIRVFEMQKGGIDFEKGNATYDHPVPAKDKYYMPVQCQQCENPPCVKACPIEATWQESDGIVVVDYNWCIGCRYCEAACPYHARRFNWEKPQIPANEINPNQSYLSNRVRPQGVMEKCTFCLHRTREGRLPACLEACPTGARVFGNVLDPDSEIRWVLENKRVFVLKEELGTKPRFYYFFDK
jgi:Fe-S-cluster-containing dehydrogenase component